MLGMDNVISATSGAAAKAALNSYLSSGKTMSLILSRALYGKRACRLEDPKLLGWR